MHIHILWVPVFRQAKPSFIRILTYPRYQGFWQQMFETVRPFFSACQEVGVSGQQCGSTGESSFSCLPFDMTNRSCQSPATANVMTAAETRSRCYSFCTLLPVIASWPPLCWVCRIPLVSSFRTNICIMLFDCASVWKQLFEWSHNPVQACKKNVLLNFMHYSATQPVESQTEGNSMDQAGRYWVKKEKVKLSL
jgi:hypothetical protein